MYVFIYIHVCVHVYMCVHVHIYIFMYLSVCIYRRAQVQVCVCFQELPSGDVWLPAARVAERVLTQLGAQHVQLDAKYEVAP